MPDLYMSGRMVTGELHPGRISYREPELKIRAA